MNRKLGLYVCFVAAGQIALYAFAYFDREPDRLVYFDPRIGLFFFESAVRGSETFPGISSAISAVVLLCVGIGMCFDLYRAGIYLVVETILAAPTMLFFFLVVLANLTRSHGFSVGELVIPVIVFAVATAIPFWWGMQSRRFDA